ncbi:CoA-dependent acyltransferase [Neocallimastix sp. 'constans']
MLLIDIHHIITDGISISIIKNKLNKYYYDESSEDLETKIQYSDYSINLNEMKINNNFENQIEFYKNMFDDDYEVISLPKYFELQPKSNMNEIKSNNKNSISVCSKIIDNNTSQLINRYIKDHGITKTSLFLSLYGYILSKYSNQSKVFTSVVNVNRNNMYVQNMIGMFASTQPLLLSFKRQENNISFLDNIKNIMNILMKIQEEENISYSELKQKIDNLKNLNNVFISQLISIFKNDSKNTIFREENDAEDIDSKDDEANKKLYLLFKNSFNNKSLNKFDIAFNNIEEENSYRIYIQYNNSIYHSTIINNVIESFIEALKNIVQYDSKISNVEYLPSTEKEKILNKFNKNIFKYEFNKLYHIEFSKIVKENPSKTAVICNGIKLSYEELDKMSNSLAYYLRNEMKIRRNEIIPIISERSFFYVIAVIATMKCGATFFPIDPEFPKNRIEYMIRESHAKFILKYITNKENDNKIRFDGIINYSLELHNYNNNTSYIENINEYNDLCYHEWK